MDALTPDGLDDDTLATLARRSLPGRDISPFEFLPGWLAYARLWRSGSP